MIPPVASKFVAGESPAEVLEHARQLRQRGVKSIINLLGEHYRERDPADDDAAVYQQLVRDVSGTDLGACVSVKPSQVGLGVSEDVLRENMADIVDAAREEDVRVWMDMEDPDTVDTTLDVYEDLNREYPTMGLCVQANLERTREDLERLTDLPGKLRLVKGAYQPPKGAGYRDRTRVNEAYREYLEYLFREHDGGVAVGSHDPAMIDHAIDLHRDHGTDFEIQMLMGVREDAQVELARDYEVYQYVPYGGKWMSYFSRRVMERKENLTFALRAVAGV
ncbi:proline dehydrogenase family protein [Halomarina litorea]|uniref:proline dehydrogenase family protein n=1 Tax=Halomarina litorea TaxID=2961595 RepID=UPI0020C416D2|nr:proline dehydrogenase family protein [Halomarina sp. BCD28]